MKQNCKGTQVFRLLLTMCSVYQLVILAIYLLFTIFQLILPISSINFFFSTVSQKFGFPV